MELLLVLIGDFMAELAMVALAPVFTLLFVVLELVLEVALKVLGRPSLFRPRREAAPSKTPSPWPRRIGKVLLGLSLVFGIAMILLNTVLFEPTLRHGLARAKEKSGVDVQFQSARGNFLSGKATLDGVTIRRQDATRSNIDLQIKQIEVDLVLKSLYGSRVRVNRLHLSGVEGTYQRSALKYPHRDFEIEQLLLEKASLVLKEPDSDPPAPSIALTVDRLECRPLRGDSVLFDLLFRSTGQGTIVGAPFDIRSDRTEHGRITAWKAQMLPVGFLSGYVGEPFDWLTAGTMDVDVIDTWSDGSSTEIDSRWKLMFRDVSAEVPPRITGFKRAIAEPVVRFIQAHPAQLPLEFQLTLQKGHFTGAASVETSGLLEAAADGMLQELARRAQVPADKLKELGRRALEGFRKFVEDRKRKKSGD